GEAGKGHRRSPVVNAAGPPCSESILPAPQRAEHAGGIGGRQRFHICRHAHHLGLATTQKGVGGKFGGKPARHRGFVAFTQGGGFRLARLQRGVVGHHGGGK